MAARKVRNYIGLLLLSGIVLVTLCVSLLSWGSGRQSATVEAELQRFKDHLSGRVQLDNTWIENGNVFYLRSTDLYNEAICHVKTERLPSTTRYGVVVRAVKLEDGYWRLTLKD